MSDLLISFFGDDFTGSTDAMESLARAGIRTVLFTAPPTPQQLARYPGIRACGLAGTTRSMPPRQMEQALRPALRSLKELGSPIVHYKVCSTFDSSPTVGSIGRAIDIGTDVLESTLVPVVVGAPSLGRYCVFGNLFARCGASEPYRLDRHPSMSRHPTTPMNEADLRLHLSKQTSKSIGLIDVLDLERDSVDLADAKAQVVLIDLLHERQLATVGRLLARHASSGRPLFVVGSSGVESALAAHWNMPVASFAPAEPADGPILALCGSCSPVTLKQIEWALAHDFVEVPFQLSGAVDEAVQALSEGRSVVIHTQQAGKADDIGAALGRVAHDVLAKARLRRVLVAGGDTSGQVATALGIESMQMIAELTRGSPLVRVSAPGSPADGIEMTFKGGQIGPVDFFGAVRCPPPSR